MLLLRLFAAAHQTLQNDDGLSQARLSAAVVQILIDSFLLSIKTEYFNDLGVGIPIFQA